MADDTPTTAPQTDPTQAFQSLLAKNNNDAMALATKLFDENYQHRSMIRELKANAPTADDAEQWSAFKALGIKADDAKKAVESVSTLEKQNKELAGMENIREVAAIGGYKVSVLKKLMAEHPDATFEFKTEKDPNDKTKEHKVALIKVGDKVSPFTEFAETNFTDFLPALKAEQEQTRPITNGNSPDPKPRTITPVEKIEQEEKAHAATGRYSL